MLAAQGAFERASHRSRLDAKIQKPRPGNFDLVANIIDIELGHDVRSQLARIHFAFLGQAHQRVALIIAKLGVGAGPDHDSVDSCVWQYCGSRLPQPLFQYFIKHGSETVLEKRGHEGTGDAQRAGVFEALGGFVQFLQRELEVVKQVVVID